MSEAVPHPYAIEVAPLTKSEGQFGWAIRRSGTLIQRSDRPYTSEAKAYEKALEAIEQDMNPNAGPRRR